MSKKIVILEEPNTEWQLIATREKNSLRGLLGSTLVSLEHIGSTSIPNIVAKPVIDFLGEVKSLDEIDSKKDTLKQYGYTWRGENGIPERRYITKLRVGHNEDLLHVHLFPAGHPQIVRHVIFRDYLLKYPDVAEKYDELKKRLASEFKNKREKYQEGKAKFIEEIISLAQKEFA